MSGSLLQDVPPEIFLPQQVEFLAGSDPTALQLGGAAMAVVSEKQPGPLKKLFPIKNLKQRALRRSARREHPGNFYLLPRVRAESVVVLGGNLC